MDRTCRLSEFPSHNSQSQPSIRLIDFVSLVLKADGDIGVISPYNAQASKLRTRLKAQYEDIKVGSVEDFQGQARPSSSLWHVLNANTIIIPPGAARHPAVDGAHG